MTEQVQQDVESRIKAALIRDFPKVKFEEFETVYTDIDDSGNEYIHILAVFDEKQGEPQTRATVDSNTRIWYELADAGIDVIPVLSFCTLSDYEDPEAEID